MAKMLTILNCEQCRYAWKQEQKCTLLSKAAPDEGILSDCPLIDAPIQSEAEYDKAMERIEAIWGDDVAPEGDDELTATCKRVECWECRSHEKVPSPRREWTDNVVKWAIHLADTHEGNHYFKEAVKRLRSAVYPPEHEKEPKCPASE